MTSWINTLRRKSKAVKDMYAFGGSLFVTGIIATIWLVSLPSQLQMPVDDTQAGADLEETKGAFSQFFTGAKEQLSNVFTSQASSTTATSTEEGVSSSSPRANIIIPQLTASTTNGLNQEAILIETIPGTPTYEAVEVLIGTTSSESSSSN